MKHALTLYPVLLHLLNFSYGFSQIVCKLFAVLRIGCIEVDEDFNVSSGNGGGQTDSVWIIYRVTLTYVSVHPKQIAY